MLHIKHLICSTVTYGLSNCSSIDCTDLAAGSVLLFTGSPCVSTNQNQEMHTHPLLHSWAIWQLEQIEQQENCLPCGHWRGFVAMLHTFLPHRTKNFHWGRVLPHPRLHSSARSGPVIGTCCWPARIAWMPVHILHALMSCMWPQPQAGYYLQTSLVGTWLVLKRVKCLFRRDGISWESSLLNTAG